MEDVKQVSLSATKEKAASHGKGGVVMEQQVELREA
jgi:hypothetical protein